MMKSPVTSGLCSATRRYDDNRHGEQQRSSWSIAFMSCVPRRLFCLQEISSLFSRSLDLVPNYLPHTYYQNAARQTINHERIHRRGCWRGARPHVPRRRGSACEFYPCYRLPFDANHPTNTSTQMHDDEKEPSSSSKMKKGSGLESSIPSDMKDKMGKKMSDMKDSMGMDK